MLGKALTDLACSYHFVAGAQAYSLAPFRIGRGAQRVARLRARTEFENFRSTKSVLRELLRGEIIPLKK